MGNFLSYSEDAENENVATADAAIASSASESKTVLDAHALRSHVECPICYDVPANGVMLMCLNGHNVCPACKDRIGAKCPLCRCDFATPPTRNRTVASLIESFPLNEWPCKYAKEAEAEGGCQFVGRGRALTSHQATCKHRQISCPNYHCKEIVSLATVKEHYGTAHQQVVRAQSDQGKKWFAWKSSFGSSTVEFSWAEQPFSLRCVKWVLPYAHLHQGQVFIWLWALLDDDEAEMLEVTYTFRHAKGHSLVFVAPVYPLAWGRQRILMDDRCARLSTWSMSKILTGEGLSEALKIQGHSAQFLVDFKVERKI